MALYRPVTVFCSSDGSTHNSAAKAAQHTRDHLCRVFDALLQPSTGRTFTRADVVQVVEALAGDDAAIGLLCRNVAPILNWIIENAEDHDNGAD